MKFYKVDKIYLEYLYQYDNKVINTNIMGIPLRINNMIYFIPFMKKVNQIQRVPTLFKLYDSDLKENYGYLLFSNMIPVPYKELFCVDYSLYEESTIIILEKVLDFIKKNLNRIEKGALRIYKQKNKNYNQNYLKATIDFKLIEKLSLKWELEKYGKHYNRFPDNYFFFTNPNIEGVSDYYLMNQITKIARISLDNKNQNVLKIKEIYNKDYSPLECFKNNVLDK